MEKLNSAMGAALLMCLGIAIVFPVSDPLAAQVRDFEPNHIRRTATVRFDAAPKAVYALLAHGGQQSLTRAWDIDVLSPPSGAIEPGSTFTKTLRRAPVQQIWTVVEADEPRRLTYAIFVAGLDSWVFESELRPDGDGGTAVDVTHTITSLSEEVNSAVQEFADTFDRYVESWSATIRRVLESGPQG